MPATAVALSRDLPPKRVMRAEVSGIDIAVWRDPAGQLHAWNNRCPHRGMRLSHGFVRGDKLACLYHGWHYGTDGVCTYIPAHPELAPPDTIRTEVYAITETDGVIWVSVNGPVETGCAEDATVPLRTLSVVSDEAQALAALAETPFRGARPRACGRSRFDLGDRRLLVRTNPVGPAETHLHVLVDRGAGLADRKALSRWCEAARTTAEAGRT
ncbi:MAG: Rieske (2Fe-2S) protein [Pseudomonadota bacterium]